MEHIISVIFHKNIELMQSAHKAVFYFRRQEYETALKFVIDTIDQATVVVEKMIESNSYFSEETYSLICELLNDVIEAKKNKDFILLSDVIESRLVPTFLQLQAWIHSKEETVYYSLERYQSNIRNLYGLMTKVCSEERRLGTYRKELSLPLETKELIDEGYRIEMTSGGVMTAAVRNGDTTFYLHSKYRPMQEAFYLAQEWSSRRNSTYYIYGFGLGYHVLELCKLVQPEVDIYVYESDIRMLKLACAFTSCLWMKDYRNLSVLYDPDLKLLQNQMTRVEKSVKPLIHYPSYQNIKELKAKKFLADFLPYESVLENC